MAKRRVQETDSFNHERRQQHEKGKICSASSAIAKAVADGKERNERGLRREAKAVEAERLKEEAEAKRALKQERQQHEETAREEFAGLLAGAAK
jgi:hypothetical protein